MKTYTREEFVRIDASFEAGKLDFYGAQSPLDAAGQKAFLSAYDTHATRRYGETAIYEKAVSGEELSDITASLEVGHTETEFYGYIRPRRPRYIGWHLYTDRATADAETCTVTLDDRYAFPLPCAVYEYGAPISRLSLSVWVGHAFLRDLPEGINPTTTGRWIELRRGHTEIIKLMFAPNGLFCYKDGTARPYHYDLCKLAPFAPDRWHSLVLDFAADTFTLTFAGETHTFPYQVSAVPDTLFLGGGMQPADAWRVRIDELRGADGSCREPFVENAAPEAEREPIGSVSLPCPLGTHIHKDEELILETTFDYDGTDRVYLVCDTLDPGGDVYLNGVLVAHRDTFTPFSVDLTDRAAVGENTVTLVVAPRAPEVLYAWHRHADPYNAWFAGRTEIVRAPRYIDAQPAVFTQSVSNSGATAVVRWALGELPAGVCDGYEIHLAPSFPTAGDSVCVAAGPLAGDLDAAITVDVTPWSPETPVLYDLAVRLLAGHDCVMEKTVTTGFRTIEQRGGAIYLNGERIILKGALSMQFLPPYDRVPINHVCPTDEEIARQALEIRRMNGNCLRMHQLGYGTNDPRFAEIFDKLGVLLIWTTRLIDAAENLMWSEEWHQREDFAAEMRAVINHPSIIVWEGSNELHTDLSHIDRVYDTFVDTVTAVDPTRLICPVSHLYYGGGIYECGCRYYNNDGTLDESGAPAVSSHGWNHPLVLRSAHTYCLLLGYGTSWRAMATQSWRWQEEMLRDDRRAYLVSEYAIIGRQNPETPEAKAFINKDSYEFGDEMAALRFRFADDEWRLSQAFQALCASVATSRLHQFGADGMLWCCLSSGANNASYLKPPLDFYGYKKWAYYALTEAFAQVQAFNSEPDVLLPQGYRLTPTLCGLAAGEVYDLSVELVGEDGRVLHTDAQTVVAGEDYATAGAPIALPAVPDGYYTIRYTTRTEV